MKTIIIFFLLSTLLVSAQTVSTYAGSTINGSLWGYVDGTITTAQFSQPVATVIENFTGTMYVADELNRRIRKITSDGVVTTFAGGSAFFLDGNGINASFGAPEGLVIDSGGTLYVVDRGWNAIRKITASGDVTTFAGSITSSSGYVDGQGTEARFNYPLGIVIDNLGNLFVTDSFNHKVRKITPQGNVSTFAGSTIGYLDATGTSSKFNNPEGITIDSNNNLYVADTTNGVIRKITPYGIVSTFVGNNAIPWLTFNVKGITRSSTGATYFTSQNHTVYSVSSTGVISQLAGAPNVFGYEDGENAKFSQPKGITLDQTETNLYIADKMNHRIRKIALENLATETFLKNKITIFPNPVNNILTIKIPENTSISNISITDLTGKKVLEQNNNSTTVNVEKLQNGIYLLQIVSEGKTATSKFIKN